VGVELKPVPNPITLYRLVHMATLPTLLARGILHAPNTTPNDGLPYRTIHKVGVQASRHSNQIWCGLGGSCHDYVPFYFGPLSVMLLNLKTGRVDGYNEGQAPLIYLTTTMKRVLDAGYRFVFSDGHGLARFTSWYDDLAQLDQVDWDLVAARYWSDKPDDNDRQRRKQAEFLVWRALDWSLIENIGVLNQQVKLNVEVVLGQYPHRPQPRVEVRSGWYY
jgi:ssDNA thymidine ADP-ribosyltransferase, DarT